jgi:hypothetical protein
MKLSSFLKKIQWVIWAGLIGLLVLYEIKAYYEDEPIMPTALFVVCVLVICCNLLITEVAKAYQAFYE